MPNFIWQYNAWENSLQSWTATSCRKNLLEFKFWRSERMSTNKPILTRNCGSSNVLAKPLPLYKPMVENEREIFEIPALSSCEVGKSAYKTEWGKFKICINLILNFSSFARF